MSSIVYLVDDDASVRRALSLLLSSVELEVKAFSSAGEFLVAYPKLRGQARECLILDVRMPGMSGLDLQVELASRHLELPVIMLSGHADVPMAVKAMRAGAVTFLEKPVNEQELIDTVLGVLKSAPARGGGGKHERLEAHRAQLTERQRSIYDLLMQGLQTKEVARRLEISPRTVEVHRSRILERLGARSFTQLIQDLLGRPEESR